MRKLLRGRDVAFVYALTVTVVSVTLTIVPRWAEAVAASSSTNLDNLRQRPLLVLFLSAFVVPSATGLWVVPFVFWVFGVVQRWLGRTSTIVAAVYGHVGATLFVAVMLVAGIRRGAVSPEVRSATDVGVSYGLLALAGLCMARLPVRARLAYVGIGTSLLILAVVLSKEFSDAGHLIAWSIGVGLGLMALASARAGQR